MDWIFVLRGVAYLAVLLIGPPVAAATMARRLPAGLKGWKRWLGELACIFLPPLAVLGWAMFGPDTQRSPQSIDGPAYMMILLVSIALIQVPVCVLAVLIGHALRRPTPHG